jgi:hypothetical protein
VKLLVTFLVIVGFFFGVYQAGMAAYGWFEMSGVVDDVATREITAVIDRQGSFDGSFGSADRYGTIRAGIVKRAVEAGVPVRSENVAIGMVDNMLDVRVSWAAPMVTYQGREYLAVPLSVERSFPLRRSSSWR